MSDASVYETAKNYCQKSHQKIHIVQKYTETGTTVENPRSSGKTSDVVTLVLESIDAGRAAELS